MHSTCSIARRFTSPTVDRDDKQTAISVTKYTTLNETYKTVISYNRLVFVIVLKTPDIAPPRPTIVFQTEYLS